MSVDINISLATRNQPIVNLTIGDDAQNLIIGTNNTAPIITSVLTGPPGPSGAAGTPDIGPREITNLMLDDGIVTDSKLATNSVTTNKILASCITSNKLSNSAVTTSKIANNAITAAKIAPGAITEELNGIFADGSLTGDKIKDGDISNVKIENNAITASKLAANSVVTAKITNGAVTGAKLENDIIIPGAKINGMFQLLGSSPAYLLGPTQDDLHIQSEAGLIFKVDHDNNSSNTFKFRNGSNSDVITIDESGNITITGNIIVNGTVDGVDVSSLPTTDTNTQLPLLDEDDMASNSSSSVPSQQSVKAYVDSKTHLELGTTSTTALAGDTTTISTAQANAIVANTAKVGITTQQASDITANNAKVGITTQQASDITTNNSKTSFPGFGTTSGTALEGDTALLQLGTTSTTALAGDTTTISSAQASAITANTAKVGITTSQADAITANTAKTSFPGFGTSAGTALEGNTTTISSSQASAITANTAKTSFPGFGTTAGTALEGNTTIPTQYTDADAVSAVEAGTIELANDLTVNSNFIYLKDQSGSGAASRFNTATLTANRTLTIPDANGTIALTSNITPTVIGCMSTRVSAYWANRYYFGHASYGWNYYAWNFALSSKTSMNDWYSHCAFVCPMSTNTLRVKSTVRNDSNTDNVEVLLFKGSRPNGSTSSITLTELGATTVTISTVDLHYNADIDVTNANVTAGTLLFLSFRRIDTTNTNATKYINVTATLYGE